MKFFLAIALLSSTAMAGLMPGQISEDPMDILDQCVDLVTGQDNMKPKPDELEQSRDMMKCALSTLSSSISEPCKEQAKTNIPATADEKETKEKRAIAAAKCFSDRLISFNAVGKSNYDGMRNIIGNTSLPKAEDRAKAETDFLTCFEDAPHFQMTVTDMIMENDDLIASILTITVNKLMDSYGRQTPEDINIFEDLRRHFVSLKGMICFTRSMLINNCDEH